MFRRRAFTHHCVGDSRLDPVDGRKWEKRLNRGDRVIKIFSKHEKTPQSGTKSS
jgi:hypothetical protein